MSNSKENDPEEWAPPARIEDIYERSAGNMFSAINRPTAGARNDDPVPSGSSPLQLYSLATPNGQKAGIILEELGIKYDAHVINIGAGVQFSRGFVEVNPNSKIPCLLDGKSPGASALDLGGEVCTIYTILLPPTSAASCFASPSTR